MMKSLLSFIKWDFQFRRPRDQRIWPALLLIMCVAGAAFHAFLRSLPGQERTTNPHGTIQIPCEECHTPEGWKPMKSATDFDHQKTKFPLRGLHVRVSCMECHVDLAFTRAGSQCTDCHADIHRRQLGADCEKCHTVHGWREVAKGVNEHTNRFPLVGAHALTGCESCHKGAAVGLFRGLNTDCAFCHIEDFRNARTVNHVEAGFTLRCESCHGTDSWQAGFNHAAGTGFALLGAHATLDCLQCHIGGKFAGTPADCVNCHLKDFNATTNPNHVTSGLPQVCSVCHNTVAWTPAVFNHSGTRFPLTGAHVAVDCLSCHVGGVFTGTPTDCNSCHSGDFAAVTDPNHVAAGISRDCAACHTTATWSGARYNQHRFPIYTGAHAGRWTSCNTECHTNSSNYSVFSCLAPCHLQAETNSKHTGVSGYVYSSTSCYACHPRG